MSAANPKNIKCNVKKWLVKIFALFQKHLRSMQIGAGAFIIAFCLSWVNVAHRPHVRWALLFLTTGAVMFLVYQIFKYVYIQIVRRRNLHSFWQNEFSSCLDELFFIGSLVFVLVFFRYKIDAMLFGLLILCLFFTRFNGLN